MINVKTTNNYLERTDTLMKYYQDVREFNVLSAEDEKEIFKTFIECRKTANEAKERGEMRLWEKYDKETKKIRDYIISSNLRFVISVAKVYGTNNNILDLINEGNIGLVEAVDTFDPDKGTRFQTHAVYLIRQKINLYRQGPDLMVKKNNEAKTHHIMSNVTNRFIQEHEREPSSEELKEYINKLYPKKKLKHSADCLTVRISSIDEAPDSDSDDNSAIGSYMMYQNSTASVNSYEMSAEIEHNRSMIESLLKNLSDRDKRIVKMHFGIGEKDGQQMAANDIGKVVGLTPERVRQIIADSIKAVQKEYAKRIMQY